MRRSGLTAFAFCVLIGVASALLTRSSGAQSGPSLPSSCVAGSLFTYTGTTPAVKVLCVAGTPPTWAIPPIFYVVTAADFTTASTTYVNVPGLAWSVAANTRYDIECSFPYTSVLVTNGIGISWTGPAAPTKTRGLMIAGINAGTTGGTTIDGNDTGSVTASSVATTGNWTGFRGLWSNGSTAGTLQMRVKARTANNITVEAGSWCKYTIY